MGNVQSKNQTYMVLGVGSIVLIGAFICLASSSRFIFFFSKQYWNVAGWLFLLLLPPIGFVLRYKGRFDRVARGRYPTWWVRWIIMLPLAVSFASAALIAAPVGWIAAATWALGEQRSDIKSVVVSVEAARSTGKGCKQRATLIIYSVTHTVCVGDHFDGATPLAGQAVLVHGRESYAGLFIQQITGK